MPRSLRLILQKYGKVSLLLSASILSGCTTLNAYKKSHNQFLDDSIKTLNAPETKEQIKAVYFTVMPDPFETVLSIDYLGTSTFDYMQCKIDKFNLRYPSSDFGKQNRRAICNDEGHDR